LTSTEALTKYKRDANLLLEKQLRNESELKKTNTEKDLELQKLKEIQ
jgi:hypothetical protein